MIEKEEANFLAHDRRRAGPHRADLRADEGGATAAWSPGAEAADMYQTYGFPPELFETLAAEHNLAFDWEGFREEMEQHGDRVRRRREDRAVPDTIRSKRLKKAMHGSQFLGYETTRSARRQGGLASSPAISFATAIDEVDHEQPIVVVLDKTPFYGEMGGQVGDTGETRRRRASASR